MSSGAGRAIFAIETNDGGYYRFGVIVKNGAIQVQTLDKATGSSQRYPVDLINPLQTNVSYTLRIVVDDGGRGFYIEAFKTTDPSIRGSYNTWRPTGLGWRFRHYIYRGTAYINYYREFDTSSVVWSPDERLSLSYDALDRLVGVTKSAGAQQGYTSVYTYNAIVTSRGRPRTTRRGATLMEAASPMR